MEQEYFGSASKTQNYNKVTSTQVKYRLAQADCEVEKLREDKFKLKSALAETIKKKESLYQEALRLHKQVTHYKAENSELLSQMSSLGDNQGLLSELKQGIIKRDKIINELRSAASASASAPHSLFKRLVQRAHLSKQVYYLLKKHINCTSHFTDSLRNGKLSESLSLILSFSIDLIDFVETTSYSPYRPLQSEFISNSMYRFKGPFNSFTHQLHSTLERSEELLSQTKRLPVPQPNPFSTAKDLQMVPTSQISIVPTPNSPLKSSPKKKSTESRPSWTVGTRSLVSIPPMRKEDGWTPSEMFNKS